MADPPPDPSGRPRRRVDYVMVTPAFAWRTLESRYLDARSPPITSRCSPSSSGSAPAEAGAAAPADVPAQREAAGRGSGSSHDRIAATCESVTVSSGFSILLFAITYIDRVCISVAGPRMQEDLGIDPVGWGWVTAMFTLSYCLFEIPTGALGDRIGPRRVLTRIVLWWSAFTSLTGAVSNYYCCCSRDSASAPEKRAHFRTRPSSSRGGSRRRSARASPASC